MHIVHVGAGFRRQTTNGVNRAVTQYARLQREAGHEVTMVTFAREATAHSIEPETGIRLVSLRVGRSPLVLGHDARAFFRENTAQGDVFHFHSAFIPRHNLAARLLRVPYVVSPHGAYMPEALKRSRRRKAAYRHLLDRRYLSRARAIHALTPIERDAINAYARSRRIVVIPNPIEFQPPLSSDERSRGRIRLGLEGDGFCALFVGRMDVQHKGLDVLIEGFRRIPPELRQRMRLVLAGPDAGSVPVRSLVRDADGQSIMLLPPVFGEEKRELLAAADCFVSPSRWEGQPTAVLEAVMLGVPVIVTREVGIEDLIADDRIGVLVELSPSSVQAALQTLVREAGISTQIPSRHTNAMTNQHRDRIEFGVADLYQ